MRILALHGYQTSSKIFYLQSNYLRKILNKDFNIEWLVPNAPFDSNNDSADLVKQYFDPPYFYWYTKKEYQGIDESINYIKSLGKVDGIIGFSQGGCFAQILSRIIKPKFVITICGVDPINEKYKKISEIPSLHIIGKQDEFRERSELLTNYFLNPNIIYHTGKHTFPPNKEIYDQIKEFIQIYEKK